MFGYEVRTRILPSMVKSPRRAFRSFKMIMDVVRGTIFAFFSITWMDTYLTTVIYSSVKRARIISGKVISMMMIIEKSYNWKTG
jgi:hypothetical protein